MAPRPEPGSPGSAGGSPDWRARTRDASERARPERVEPGPRRRGPARRRLHLPKNNSARRASANRDRSCAQPGSPPSPSPQTAAREEESSSGLHGPFVLSAPRPRAWAGLPRAVALGREASECVERSRCAPQGEMASYVDNSFRQAVMKNPAERTPQVRSAASRGRVGVCRLRLSSV